MNNEQLILERLDALEKQVAPLAESARSLGELRDDLAPRVNEAVHALIAELADVEADFQLEDLLFLIKKAMRNVNNLSFTLDQLKNLIDFALTAEPLLKSSVPQMIFYLDDLEQKGVFRILNTALDVLKKIGETYTAEDMAQIGDGLVRLIGVVQKLTTLKAVDFLDKAAELPTRIDIVGARAVGPIGLLMAMGSRQAREGLGVLLELTKALAVLKEQPA